jgi:hypothetical protein
MASSKPESPPQPDPHGATHEFGLVGVRVACACVDRSVAVEPAPVRHACAFCCLPQAPKDHIASTVVFFHFLCSS